MKLGNEAISGRVQSQLLDCFNKSKVQSQVVTINSTTVSNTVVIIRQEFSCPSNPHVSHYNLCGYIFFSCPQLLSIRTSVEVLFSSLCTSATILRFSSVTMHAISKMLSLVTSRPARDRCISWTKHYISSMVKFQRLKQGQTLHEYWCTHLSSMEPTDHTVSRCTYGQSKIHNVHKGHSQIKCITTKSRSLRTTMVRKSVQLVYHVMFKTLHIRVYRLCQH